METSKGHIGDTAPHPALRKVLIDLGIMTLIGVLLAIVGPLGSFDTPLAWRFVYWLSFAYVGYACYRPVTVVAQRMAGRLALPVWAMVVVGVLVASVPMTAAVWVLGRLPGALRWPTLDQALQVYFYVLLIGGGVTLLFMATRKPKGGAFADPASVAPPIEQPQLAPKPDIARQPAFLDRLPAHLGCDLLALEMEDHYVRAHTALGSELILLRMRDAVAELDGTDGAQVHRSWWVARDAVEEVKRDGRALRLMLPGGLEAPISRARVAELKEAGWL